MITQIPDFASTQRPTTGEGALWLRRGAFSAAMTLLLATLWMVLHRYPGIDNDGQLYAFQALARLHPAFTQDLYLKYASQDAYTLFSPLYAALIRWLDLRTATLVLTVTFIAGFIAAGGALARALYDKPAAWLAAGALVIIPGHYGGAGVFHFSDLFLTARMPAEALILAALALHFWGRAALAFVLAAAAFTLHPIMALPGLLLLVCLSVPERIALLGAVIGTAAVAMAAAAAVAWPHALPLTVMDAPWLEVVTQRSHFLFLTHWGWGDWETNALPFLCLALSATVIAERRVRRLCLGAVLVGAAGLAVAYAASLAPVAILVQGQAWRWVWLTDCVCVVLLAPTLLELLRNPQCGAICALLLLLGWTDPSVDALACVGGALGLWLLRDKLTIRAAGYLRWAAVALGLVMLAWTVAISWDMIAGASSESGREPLWLTRTRNIVGLELVSAVLLGACWRWLTVRRSWHALAAAVVTLLAAAAYLAPKSFDLANRIGSSAQSDEFADFRAVIPETSNVFLAGHSDPGAFVWFALQRPNYLSIDQSAGVVFSRATALEVKRRSNVVLPLETPDWRLLDRVRDGRKKSDNAAAAADHKLTAERLKQVCEDPELGFVVSKDDAGGKPLEHLHPGPWQHWKLYDCRPVRAEQPPA